MGAIIDFLDATCGGTPVVPASDGTVTGSLRRARALQIAEIINSGIHPLQNLGVLKAVKVAQVEGAEVDGRGFGKAAIAKGLAAVEQIVASAGGRFAVGDTPTIADICIIPQLYNARRFEVDLDKFPHLLRVEAACAEML